MEATATKSPDLTGFSREAVEAISRSRNEPDWVRAARLKAWETYESIPMPTRGDEEWRRTDLRRLKLDRFAPYADLDAIVRGNGVAIGVIATPAGAAQAVCDDLVASGVTSILNFAPAVLTVPPGVDVRKVDLSIELQILAYHEQRKTQGQTV
jgi:hypothetical protein